MLLAEVAGAVEVDVLLPFLPFFPGKHFPLLLECKGTLLVLPCSDVLLAGAEAAGAEGAGAEGLRF